MPWLATHVGAPVAAKGARPALTNPEKRLLQDKVLPVAREGTGRPEPHALGQYAAALELATHAVAVGAGGTDAGGGAAAGAGAYRGHR